MVGRTISHYEIIEKLGEGGMGVVYRARDLRLNRDVALKFLPPETADDAERQRRLVAEAKAASALDHPNIVTIYEIGETGDAGFIAMEYIPGKTLGELTPPGGMEWPTALKYASAIAGAIAAAHRAGLIHRDLKPGNIIVSNDGLLKILDFGLAKMAAASPPSGVTAKTITESTQAGRVVGTVAYMSPEQLEGVKLDARSDVFSFGSVFYEMLTGQRPFHADSEISTILAILRGAHRPVRALQPKLPAEIERILNRCLEKDRSSRYPSAVELHEELAACERRLSAAEVGVRSFVRGPRLTIPAAVVLLALIGSIGWFWFRSSRTAWAINTALPEIQRLADSGSYAEASDLAQRARKYIPGDARLEELSRAVSFTLTVETTPPGAEVRYREYAAEGTDWRILGRAPLKSVRVPRGLKRWVISKPGFGTVEAARSPEFDGPSLQFWLDKADDLPAGMVRVPASGGSAFMFLTGLDHLRAPALESYLLDTREVTNRQFAAFIAAGGYRKSEFWKYPAIKGGRELSWQEAMAEFRDSTGQPGPATWELGSYPAGQADLPVTGVSWYEAEAYSEFAGKALPSIYHWSNAAFTVAGFRDISPVVRLSNFGGKGLLPGDKSRALNPYGAYDLAGNAKEWCWNSADSAGSRRYILGGAWNEPVYMFNDPDAQPPIIRQANYGFRCVKYLKPVPSEYLEPAAPARRDYSSEKPASEDAFRIYRSFYSYDKLKLKPVVESVDESHEQWKAEKVSFAAAYGNERLTVYLYLPRRVSAPYQAVLFFPGSNTLRTREFPVSAPAEIANFIVQGGRALVQPVYKSTYERGDGLLSDRPNMTNSYRDHVIQWYKDFSLTLDYLEGRKDIDAREIGYYGYSWGATMAPIILSQDNRVKAAVLACGGFWQQKGPPEVEQINFVPRVKIPVLMLNGKFDFAFPVDISQLPMFRLVGTPAAEKQRLDFDSGHSLPRKELITETLKWFDRYLGPVK